MSSKENKIELLAPAGDFNSLKAALIAGADAIYLAGKRFGARAFAPNFDEKGLRWARRVTCALNRKLYITLNTIVYDHEWKLFEDAIDFYERLQPDALIIQDLGVANVIRKRGSLIPLHLSTQGAWWGVGGEEELKALGITRVILPREMTLEEIKAVSRKSSFEIETFVHGAMCYSVSGRCYWSAALGKRSGNRGTCAQPCRREYNYIDDSSEKGFFFSPKDMRLIKYANELEDCGVASLKIEGRMKSPEYVYQVVKSYKNALLGKEQNVDTLDEVFSRASHEGFAAGENLKGWNTEYTPGRDGVVIAVVTGKSKSGLNELRLIKEVKPGDGIFWYVDGQKVGTRVTWVKKEGQNNAWVRGISGRLKAGTEIRRSGNSDEGSWEPLWDRNWERRPVDLFWSGHDGQPLAVEFKINGHPGRLKTYEKLQYAVKTGLEQGIIEEKFKILGENFQSGRNVMLALGEKLFISAGSLKKLKKRLVETLNKLENIAPPRIKPEMGGGLIKLIQSVESDSDSRIDVIDKSNKQEVFIRVWNQSFPFVRDIHPDKWVLPLHGDLEKSQKIVGNSYELWIPPSLNESQFKETCYRIRESQTRSFLCMSWEVFELKRMFPDREFRIDWCFNIANSESLRFILSKNLSATISPEWKDERLPDNIKAIRIPGSWNPLVSLSRFPSALSSNGIVCNSHNDQFFMLNVGNGLSGLFLQDHIANISKKGSSSVQIDIAIGPKENPVQVAKDLNRIIEVFKSGK